MKTGFFIFLYVCVHTHVCLYAGSTLNILETKIENSSNADNGYQSKVQTACRSPRKDYKQRGDMKIVTHKNTPK